jgi:hypothetical protein
VGEPNALILNGASVNPMLNARSMLPPQARTARLKEVVVQLAPQHAEASDTAAGELAPFKVAQSFGTKLSAMHPGSKDSALARWFTARVNDADAAPFVEKLRTSPEVTAAYVKPPASLP